MYLVDGTMRQGRYLDGLEVQRLRPVCTGTQWFVGACGLASDFDFLIPDI